MEERGEREVVRRGGGCIRTSRGPWVVRRMGRDGQLRTSLRRPSDRERQNNKLRERQRRKVAGKIFACLRALGGYHLPNHADQNDVLKALCRQAGWHVDDDGTLYPKVLRCGGAAAHGGKIKEGSEPPRFTGQGSDELPPPSPAGSTEEEEEGDGGHGRVLSLELRLGPPSLSG